MRPNLYWLQCGGCSGDTMSMLSADTPNIAEATNSVGLEVLFHPSFSALTPARHLRLLDELTSGALPLDILCVEGTVITGPNGSGMFETFAGRPKKDLIAALAARAGLVVAVGTCAAFGGVTRAGGVGGVGLQFDGKEIGGFLGPDFVSRDGSPVINLPGCPVHPQVLVGTLSALTAGKRLKLNERNAPLEYYNMLVHQGCTRNEYHEYQIEETDFGQMGCLFFHMGCHGPLAHGPCNKFLWNNRSCKTRSGIPCFGCTEPDFPQDTPFFETPNIVGLPINLPDGVDRPHYLAYKGMAAAAAPERLKHRQPKV